MSKRNGTALNACGGCVVQCTKKTVKHPTERMRFIYHLITLGTLAHCCGFLYAPECVDAYRLMLPVCWYALSYWCFRVLVTMDPGVAPKADEEVEDSAGMCRFCGLRKGPSTKHCHVCGKCVDGFDHHCDVLDICVAAGNIGMFRTFLIVHSILLSYAGYHTWNMISACVDGDQNRLLYLVLMIVEISFAGAFFIFWTFYVILVCFRARTYDIVKFMTGPRRATIPKPAPSRILKQD